VRVLLGLLPMQAGAIYWKVNLLKTLLISSFLLALPTPLKFRNFLVIRSKKISYWGWRGQK
jgi:hypothetical protein